MPRRVDEEIVSPAELQADVAHVDGDALVALGLEGVGHEGPFEGHAAALAHRLERLDFAVGEGAGLVEQAADEGRFAVIDVADDHEPQGPARISRGVALAPALAHHMYPSARRRSKASSALVVHGAARALGGAGLSSSAMISSMSAALLATGMVMSLIAERAVALAAAREIEPDHRDALALEVAPDVELGPIEHRVDAQMRRRAAASVMNWSQNSGGWSRKSQREPSPRGLKTRSFAARRLLVAADAGDHAAIAVRRDRHLRPAVLRAAGACRRRKGRIDVLECRAGGDDEVEPPFLGVAVAERIHLGKLLAGIDVEYRKRDAAEEGLRASQSMTFESLPIDHSMAGRSIRLKASRMM